MAGSVPRRRSRRNVRSGLRPDDAILGVVGGIGLTYFALIPHGFEHPWHWLAAAGGGLIGGLGVWLYADRDHVLARARGIAGRWRSGESARAKAGRNARRS